MQKKSAKVVEFMKKLNMEKSAVDKLDEEINKHSLSKFVFAMRCKNQMTQTDMSKKTGWSQSKVSKMESASDDQITIQDLSVYLNALNLELEIGVRPKNMKIVDRIKYHVLKIKKYLETLSNLAGEDEALGQSVFKFHEEALFNMVKFIQESASTLKIKQKSISATGNIHIINENETNTDKCDELQKCAH